MNIRIPENLYLEQLLERETELLERSGLKNDTRLRDKIACLCYFVHIAQANRRDNVEATVNSRIERPQAALNATILKAVMYDYLEVINLSIHLGIIVRNDSYEVGVEAKKYRFTDTYFGVAYKNYRISTYTLEKAIRKSIQKHHLEQKKKHPSFLRKFWETEKLKIDVKNALRWIGYNQTKETEYLNEKYAFLSRFAGIDQKMVARLKHEAASKLNEKYAVYKTIVRQLHEARATNYKFHFDHSGERLYTRLTNLKKQLRLFVGYDGKTLCSIDVKNSQPYLALGLFNKQLWEKGNFEKNLKKGVYWKERGKESDLIYIIMLLKRVETQVSKASDYIQFRDLVINGSLYEHLMETFGGQLADFKDRQMAKIIFLEFMYHNSNAQWKGKAEINAIKELFPTITAIFSEIKRNDYAILPILLQAFERYLIIDIICKNIHEKDAKIPLFTIHDSIITTEEFAPLVEAVMTEELTAATGYPPTLGIDTWHPDHWRKNPEQYNIKIKSPIRDFINRG